MKSIKTLLLTVSLVVLSATAGYASQVTPTTGAAGSEPSRSAGAVISQADEKTLKELLTSMPEELVKTVKPGMCLTSLDSKNAAPEDYRKIVYSRAQEVNQLFNNLGYHNVLFDHPEYIYLEYNDSVFEATLAQTGTITVDNKTFAGVQLPRIFEEIMPTPFCQYGFSQVIFGHELTHLFLMTAQLTKTKARPIPEGFLPCYLGGFFDRPGEENFFNTCAYEQLRKTFLEPISTSFDISTPLGISQNEESLCDVVGALSHNCWLCADALSSLFTQRWLEATAGKHEPSWSSTVDGLIEHSFGINKIHPTDLSRAKVMQQVAQKLRKENGICAYHKQHEQEALQEQTALAVHLPLLGAAKNGDATTCSALLDDKNIDSNWKHPRTGESALHLATEEGHLAVVELLLKRGASIDLQNKSGDSALIIASEYDHPAIVTALLDKKANIAIKDSSGRTALMNACLRGSHHSAQVLLEKNADVTTKDSNGKTALTYATAYSSENHKKTVQLLLAHHADPAELAGIRLLEAAKDGNEQALLTLLKNPKLTINWQDQNGKTALMYACDGGHDTCVELLLQNKASVTITDQWGNTALMLASNCKPSTLELLCKHGADIHAKNKCDHSVLEKFLDNFKLPCQSLSWILATGAELRGLSDYYHEQAIASAMREQNTLLVKRLLQCGAKPGHGNLRTAINEHNISLLQLLLDSGVKPEQNNVCEAIDMAVRDKKYVGLVQTLLHYGATLEDHAKKDYLWQGCYALNWKFSKDHVWVDLLQLLLSPEEILGLIKSGEIHNKYAAQLLTKQVEQRLRTALPHTKIHHDYI